KRIRTETKISEMAVSVSYAAVELAKKIFSDLGEKTVLLVGAGEMAKLAARHFIASGVRHVRVTTRNPQQALELADRFGGTAVVFEEFRNDMASADIVLVSTGAAHYLVCVDEVGIVRQWLQSLEVTPTIVALRARIDDIKQAELDKALGRLGSLTAQERELVEAMASSIVNKLIHNTMVTLKAEVNSSEGAAFVEAARRFFNLGDPVASNVNGNATSASETSDSSQEDIQGIEEVTPRVGSKMPNH